MSEELKACKNAGCRKKFSDSENHDQACKHHTGKPMFHDLRKGWTCCNKIVYDWDEFEKIEPCAVGSHSDKKADAGQNQDAFYKSGTVSNAAKAIEKENNVVVVKLSLIHI
eukprot:TRINITY_DN4226_c0_g1_i15.p3 TRINITY_DN4226_c0_g1~~TRINITY_DN4226_c0_g1_i15.p3  ORF type:complete len:111 (+),score=25.95 TRINITY_DN4226_c0_g1_i15:175-507(+)